MNGIILSAIWAIIVLLLVCLIFCFCLYLSDRIKRIQKTQKIIRDQNQAIYELLLKIVS